VAPDYLPGEALHRGLRAAERLDVAEITSNWDFVLPLAIHCGIHSLSTLAITLYLKPSLWWLAILDFIVHFTMDRLKAGPRYLGRFSDIRSKAYWVSFGLDQMVHHLTHIYICWMLAQV
jgi:hypothetical protein